MKTRLTSLMMATLLIFSTSMFATNYYVSTGGNDENDGLSVQTPKYDIRKLEPMLRLGDTVFFLEGTYNLYDVDLTALDSYEENNESENPQYIVWKAYEDENGKAEVILSNPGGGWNGCIKFAKGTAYRAFEGITFKGSALPVDDPKNAIDPATGKLVTEDAVHRRRCFDGTIDGGECHHIRINNCTFKDWSGQAVAFNLTDFITIENSEFENCMAWSPWKNSVIELNFNTVSMGGLADEGSEERIIIRNNKIHDNVRRNDIDPATGLSNNSHGIYIAAGNGDVTNNYDQFIVIENNLIYGNGGSGININATPQFVKIVNNTLYNNSVLTSEPSLSVKAFGPTSIIANNIVVAVGEKVRTSGDPGQSMADYNLFFGGVGSALVEVGGHSVFADPKFYDTTPTSIDLMIQNGSPAIDAGNDTYAPILDFEGNARVGKADIGAYENTNGGGSGIDTPEANANWFVYPSRVQSQLTINLGDAQGSEAISVAIFNLIGQRMLVDSGYTAGNTYTVNCSQLPAGSYLVKVSFNGAEKAMKFIK